MATFWMGCASNVLLAGVLALLAWTASKCLRSRPAIAHALWLLVLLKLVTPPLVEIPLPGWVNGPVAVAAQAEPASTPVMERVPAAQEPPAAVPLLEPDVEEDVWEDDGVAVILPPASVKEETPAAEAVADEEEAAPLIPTLVWNLPWSWILLGLWGTGTLVWWSLAAWRVRQFQRLLRLGDPADERIQRLAQAGAKRLELDGCPDILCVPAPISPMVWAWGGQAQIILPSELVRQLSDTELSTLLLHELAHVKRGDHWTRWLEALTLGLQWWNPLAWWAKRELQQAEEACCDAWVLWSMPEGKASYAVAMVRAMDCLAASPARLPAGASGLGQVQLLKRRIHMLNHGAARALPRGGRWVVLAFALFVLPLGTLLAQDDDPPPARGGSGAGRPGQPPRSPRQDDGRSRDRRGGDDARQQPPGVPQSPNLTDDQKQDLLFEAEISVKQAELQVRSRHHQLEGAELEIQMHANALKRLENLHQKGFASAEELDATRFRVQKAQTEIKLRKDDLEQAELHLLMVKRRLTQYRAGRFPAPGMGRNDPFGGGRPEAGGGMGGGRVPRPPMGGPPRDGGPGEGPGPGGMPGMGGGPGGGVGGGRGGPPGGPGGAGPGGPAGAGPGGGPPAMGGLGGPGMGPGAGAMGGPGGGRSGGMSGSGPGSRGGPDGVGGMSGRRSDPNESATRLIQRMDQNKDGKLSAEEWPGFYTKEQFQEFDKNRDGFVDLEELKAMVEHTRRSGGMGLGGPGGTPPAVPPPGDEPPGRSGGSAGRPGFGGGDGAGRPGAGGGVGRPGFGGDGAGRPGAGGSAGRPGSPDSAPGAPGGGRRGDARPDMERRIEELERTIQRLTEELEKARDELKKRRPDAGR